MSSPSSPTSHRPRPTASNPEQGEETRRANLCYKNGLDYAVLKDSWVGERAIPRTQLFSSGIPKFRTIKDVWRPLIDTYFHWFKIPRERFSDVWSDIVECILQLKGVYVPDPEFRLWAFGCMIRFILEDRKPKRTYTEINSIYSTPFPRAATAEEQYDPMFPSAGR
jgi:hypothetical protein